MPNSPSPPATVPEAGSLSGTRLPHLVFLGILAAGILEVLRDFPLLPERMASHFGASGMPNGWMAKPQFLEIYAIVLLPALALEFWVARRVSTMPAVRLNLPNKDYWLSPERREATFAYFKQFFAWYGCAVLALEVFAMSLAMRANLNPPPMLPTAPIISALAAFSLISMGAVVAMYRRFSMPT